MTEYDGATGDDMDAKLKEAGMDDAAIKKMKDGDSGCKKIADAGNEVDAPGGKKGKFECSANAMLAATVASLAIAANL